MFALRLRFLRLANAVDVRRNHIRTRRMERRICRQNYNPYDMPEAEFVETFRLGQEAVRELVAELTPYIPKPKRSDGIKIETKILIALAFYATGSHQTLIGQSVLHKVSQKTVSRAVRQVTAALNKREIYNKYIRWPINVSDRNNIRSKFFQKFGVPGVLGCIDGTQVSLLRPDIHEERFYNRKGYHSLNVMIICDSELNIMCVDASNPGSICDANVWQNHPLCQYINNLIRDGEEGFLLGDSGYPLRENLMTPILNTIEGTPQHLYYLKHLAAHNTVEQCIEVLKARFRCLLAARMLHYDPITSGKIVNACCVLHNIANATRSPIPQLAPEEAHAEALCLQQDEHNSRAELRNSVEEADAQGKRRINRDLVEGRVLQQALVNTLWKGRNT